MRCVAPLHTRLSCSWELICRATQRHENWHAEGQLRQLDMSCRTSAELPLSAQFHPIGSVQSNGRLREAELLSVMTEIGALADQPLSFSI